MSSDQPNRRDFIKTAVGAGVAAAAAGSAAPAGARIVGANNRINVALIGVGGRGRSLLTWLLQTGALPDTPAQLVMVCDVYQKRLDQAKSLGHCDGALDYREVLDRKDVDAVIIATPDHWHAALAIAALEKGKDVYVEKPMTHTVEEAKRLTETVKRTGRVLQVGSQTTSSDQWWQARKAIADGMIGKLIMSQGSYHRNSTGGEWNYTIDPNAGPDKKGADYIDWKTWLGTAPSRPFNPERFFRFRKFWDYSGGIATDLFYHVMAPLNLCWGKAQFPYRVSGNGGIYVFNDGREVPDTFCLTADYAAGHTVVLSSSMANDTHIPGLIRGHEGTIMMVPNGEFEGHVDHITVTPQRIAKSKFEAKYNTDSLVIPCEFRESHMANWLRCIRTRETPVLDALTGYKTLTTIAMSVQSYREGRVLYFDEASERVRRDRPPMPKQAS
jgi:predicted dehydrogenase